MIPLRDRNPSKGVPVVTYAIILGCVLAFLYEIQLGRYLSIFFMHYGLVPVRYTQPEISMHFTLYEQAMPLFTSMFLHGGWLHLIGNMWTLYIFGDNVEGELGHVKYLLFYLLSGLIAAAIHVITNAASAIPTIGASGAVAGVMGAYIILYPRARILTFVPIFFFLYLMEIPAYVFLGFWFFLQFFYGAFALAGGMREFAGVAWWAHVGGFIGGILLLGIFRALGPFSRENRRGGW